MPQSELRLYFENPVGRILEHPDGYAVVEYHPGPRKMHHLTAFLTHTGQLLERRGWNRMLGDQRLMTPYTDEERAWIIENWLHRDGDMYGAVLVPNDVFARLSVSQVMTEAKTEALTYRMFDNQDAAEAWLRQQR